MQSIIIAILLAAFIIGIFRYFRKFLTDKPKVDPKISLIKRIGIGLLFFACCYIFAILIIPSYTPSVNETREVVYLPNQASTQPSTTEHNNSEMFNSTMDQNKPNQAAFHVIKGDELNTKFEDLGGLHVAKEEVQDIIKFLQNPDEFSRLGARSPKGVLLYGEPGTGKTMLARAIAGEAKVSFIGVAGSEFDQEYIGVGAARVRQLFETARENAPCIIFIDEIDALAHKRHPQEPAWVTQTVNQLLTEMDGLDSERNKGIVVIGASNRISIIEPAVLRPGRLDRHIKLGLLTEVERQEILAVILKRITKAADVTPQALAKITKNFSGAELANLVNEAAIHATKKNKSAVDLQDFQAARERMLQSMKRQQLERQKPIEKRFTVIPADEIKTKFSDVAGLHEAKDEVQDIIKFLRDPTGFSRLGAKVPKGALFFGEPGTGKTLLARAIAGEAKVSFITTSGAEFDERWVGVGAARIRELFATARENAPCIIFIDEIDALASKRIAGDNSGNAQTVNQLLVEMDGLEAQKNDGIIVIGASNRLGMLDPAILRPGRLDRHIKIDVPTTSERAEILKVHLSKIVVSKNVTDESIAKMTTGFSGADLANLVNEAAINATKHNKISVDMQDFDFAKDRVVLGSTRAALKVSDKVRKITAYHEAGHALVGHYLSAHDNPIYKVTITPRGPSLGHTSFEPSKEEYSVSLKQIEARIATLLAGRLAEEIVFGAQNITTGAESDLQAASDLAYNMVTRWGYSKRVGLLHNESSNEIISNQVIEREMKIILDRNYARARELLIKNRAKLEKLSNELLKHETLDSAQVKRLLD